MEQPRILRTFLTTGIVLSILLACVWYFLGRTALEKIATVLALPCGMLWYGLLCLTILSFQYTQRRLAVLTGVLFLAYTVLGNGFFAESMARSLEADYYTCEPLLEEPFDVVIVLGGGAGVGANGRVQGSSSGDRVILAAQLYHAGLTSQIACTGTRIVSMDASGSDPGDNSADVLTKLGVPASAIIRVAGRTTSEEMSGLSKTYTDNATRIGLVTSAWHMPRAIKLATKNGLNPVPLPSDFQSSHSRERTAGEKIYMCIPQADAFFGIARMTKEYMGMAVGR